MSELSEFRLKLIKNKQKNKLKVKKLEEKILSLQDSSLVLTKKEFKLMCYYEKKFLETRCDSKTTLERCVIFNFDEYKNPVTSHKAN